MALLLQDEHDVVEVHVAQYNGQKSHDGIDLGTHPELQVEQLSTFEEETVHVAHWPVHAV